MNLTRKKPEPVVVDEPVALTKPGGKNAPTPRRNAARAQRAKTVKGAPATKKEARAKIRAAQTQARESLKETDLAKLPVNERRPELVYTRDLVDTRTHLAAALIPVLVVYFVATFVLSHASKGAQMSLFFLSFFWLIAIVVDAVIMARRVETRVRRRHPDTTEKIRGYAVRRALAPKRMRRPVVREIPPANHWKASSTS